MLCHIANGAVGYGFCFLAFGILLCLFLLGLVSLVTTVDLEEPVNVLYSMRNCWFAIYSSSLGSRREKRV